MRLHHHQPIVSLIIQQCAIMIVQPGVLPLFLIYHAFPFSLVLLKIKTISEFVLVQE